MAVSRYITPKNLDLIKLSIEISCSTKLCGSVFGYKKRAVT